MQILRIHQVALGNHLCLVYKHLSSYAPQVFDELSHRSTFHQSTNLTCQSQNIGYDIGFTKTSKRTDAHESLASFVQLNRSGTKPTRFLLCTALNSCAKTLYLSLGLQIHASIVKFGLADLFINSALVDLYAKCSSTTDARYLIV